MTTTQVARALGCTVRMLQHWDETGTVRPQVIGKRRVWRGTDVREAHIVSIMRRKGIRIPDLKKHVAELSAAASSSIVLWKTEALRGRPRFKIVDVRHATTALCWMLEEPGTFTVFQLPQ